MEVSNDVLQDRAKGFWRFTISLLLAIPIINIFACGVFLINSFMHIFLRSAERGKDLLSLTIFLLAWAGAALIAFVISGGEMGGFLVTVPVLQFLATFMTIGRLRHLL